MTVLRDRSQSSISEEDIRPWNTYGSFNTNSRSFSSHDGTSAAIPSAVAPDARVHRHDPYAAASQPYRREAVNIKWGVSHQPLIGSCFYIPFPKIRAVTHSTTTPLPEGAVQLQIRQVRFETETGQIRWLVRRLTGVHVIKAEKMVPGVLHIWVRSTQDADRICNILHHNILFDFQGVFAPLNIEQKQAVMAYIETRQFHTRSQRLPREPMTVTRMYAPPPPPPPPAFALASAPTSPLL